MKTIIRYGKYEDSAREFENILKDAIAQFGYKSILDVGAGANPALNENFIRRAEIDYTILDISEAQLQKASKNYHRIVADAASPKFTVDKMFDLVFSRMVVGHIKDVEQFHKNMRKILTEEGMAIHFFSTLYSFPFFVNYILHEKITDKLLDIFAPRDKYKHAKLPAYYNWCRGPLLNLIKKYNSLGYDVVEYVGFFGHDYYENFKFLNELHKIYTRNLLKKPSALLTSYAFVILRKKSEEI